MATATFRLARKSIPVIIEKVREFIAKLIVNVAAYPTPNPPALTLTAQVDNLENSYQAAIRGGTDKKAMMNLDKQKLLVSMSLEQGYIQTTSGGDPDRILLVCDVKKPGEPAGILPPPQNMRSAYGKHEGEIIVRWKGVPKRTSYKLQINRTPNDDTRWEDVVDGLTGKRRFVVSGLVSGANYGFRVATVSSEGIGGWSDPTYHKAA